MASGYNNARVANPLCRAAVTFVLLLGIAIPHAAAAQVPGSHLQDSAGGPLSNATIKFAPVDSDDYVTFTTGLTPIATGLVRPSRPTRPGGSSGVRLVSPNGRGDIAEPLNNAIAACTAPHCSFLINATGNVNVDSQIVVTKPGVTIACSSPSATTLLEQAYPQVNHATISVASNVLTVATLAQNYRIGDVVYVHSSVLGTLSPLFVTSATATGYSANFTHANVATTADNGWTQQIGGIIYAEADNFELSHCGFNTNNGVQSSGVGVAVQANGVTTANNAKIHDNVFTDPGTAADFIVLLRVVGATTTSTANNAHIYDNRISGPWIDVAIATDANYAEIGPGNYLYEGEHFDLNGDYGASVASVDGTTFHDNWIVGGTGGSYVQDATHTTISHNHFINWSSNGQAAINYVQPFYPAPANNLDTDNVFEGGYHSGPCIAAGQESQGLVIDGDSCSHAGQSGITLLPWTSGAPGPSNVTIKNTYLKDNGQSAPNSGRYCGIEIQAGVTGIPGVSILNNTAIDDQSPATAQTQAYAVCGTGSGYGPSSVRTVDNVFPATSFSATYGTHTAFYFAHGCTSCSLTEAPR